MKKKIAIVFPGQGSQSVGMLSELYANYAIVRDTYAEASDELDFDLWQLTYNGPKEELDKTVNTQPAVLVAGVACWRVLQKKHVITPSFLAGHSLGEYTALVASKQLAFREAVLLARKRAKAMQLAVPDGVGSMAVILGLDNKIISKICGDISIGDYKVWLANDNAPGQIVIAGHKTAVTTACQKLKTAGAKRAMILPVSVPSHCPLMKPAVINMKKALLQTKWTTANVPIIHNYDVASHSKVQDITKTLLKQLTKPVRWVETVQYFTNNGIEIIIEVGPGKVLSGLNKRINKNIKAKSVFDEQSLNDALAIIKN